jgi:co-chaperonin GroES (HSP10)
MSPNRNRIIAQYITVCLDAGTRWPERRGFELPDDIVTSPARVAVHAARSPYWDDFEPERRVDVWCGGIDLPFWLGLLRIVPLADRVLVGTQHSGDMDETGMMRPDPHAEDSLLLEAGTWGRVEWADDWRRRHIVNVAIGPDIRSDVFVRSTPHSARLLGDA